MEIVLLNPAIKVTPKMTVENVLVTNVPLKTFLVWS